MAELICFSSCVVKGVTKCETVYERDCHEVEEEKCGWEMEQKCLTHPGEFVSAPLYYEGSGRIYNKRVNLQV
jgi:hypothetical protein